VLIAELGSETQVPCPLCMAWFSLGVRQQLGRRKKKDGAFIKWASLTHRKKVNVSILTQHQMKSMDQKRKKCSEEDEIMTKIKTAQIDRAGGMRERSPPPHAHLLPSWGHRAF